MCLRLSDARVICRCYLLSVSNSVLFFNISLTRLHHSHVYGSGPHQHCSIGQYWTTDVAENLGQRFYGTQRISQGNDFEVILTVKMETTKLDIP